MRDPISSGTLVGGRYRVVEALGSGGMGATYAAEDTRAGHQVAIKALELRTPGDSEALALFEREARVLESLDHPSVPSYVDRVALREGGEIFYLVQDLVEGQSLAQRVVGGWRPDEAELRRVARAMLETLVYLHSRQPPVVHRDIKPENVIMRPSGGLALVDFGAVKDALRGESAFASADTDGTMAPEQARGHGRPGGDLYGVGATLVHLMTRQPPSELPQKHRRIDFRGACQVSEALSAWVDGLIEPAPEDRFATAAEALSALDALERGDEGSAGSGDPFEQETPEPDGGGYGDGEVRVPAGSRVTVVQEGQRIDVSMPPVGWRGMSGANFMRLFAGLMMSSFAILSAPVLFEEGAFGVFMWLIMLAPFGFMGLYLLLYRVLLLLFYEHKVSLDPERLTIEVRFLGFTHSKHEGQTADIDGIGLGKPSKDEAMGKIYKVAQCVHIHDEGGAHEIGRRLTLAENEWLVGVLNDHLVRIASRTSPSDDLASPVPEQAEVEAGVAVSVSRR